MNITNEEQCSEIARLLTSRCNNCYNKLPGYDVHGAGWHWITSDVGPYCDDCWKEILPNLKEEFFD